MAEVLFQLSGSIAAYKACQVISRLVQAGCNVQTVATRSALEFVGPATLEGLTGRPVATDTFAGGSQMDHIRLVRRADVIVLCPATANTVNRLAAGVADDLVGTMFLAHDFAKPYLLVPAMNTAMYQHPATAASLDRLRAWGIDVLEPDSGSLACGEIGPGRLAEPDTILAAVLDRVGLGAVDRVPAGRVLITAGGVRVPIDGVRSITNTSSGATGAAIAEGFARAGWGVTLLHATDAVVPDPALPIERRPFTTFNELGVLLAETLSAGSYDAALHLAAVSDYDIDHVVIDGRTVAADPGGKLDTGDTMAVHLKRNPKLLRTLKTLGGDQLVVVGFKLTNGADAEQRRAAVRSVSFGTDLVVHNDATEKGDDVHRATIYRGDDVVATAGNNAELAVALVRAVTGQTGAN